MPVDDDKQVQKSFLKRQISYIYAPYLVLMINYKIAQQIWPYILFVIPFAQVGSRIQRNNVHQAADSFFFYFAAVMIFQIVSHLAISPGRLGQMCPVNDLHYVQVLRGFSMGRIKKISDLLSIHTAAIDFQKFALPFNRQFFVS